MEDAWPEHCTFSPREELLPEPSRDPSDASGTLGPERSAERLVPPPPHRVSAAEFDALDAEGAFVSVHEKLFLHSKRRTRVGALPSLLVYHTFDAPRRSHARSVGLVRW